MNTFSFHAELKFVLLPFKECRVWHRMYLLLLKGESGVMKAWSCQRGAKLLSIEEREGLREENWSRQNSGEITEGGKLE